MENQMDSELDENSFIDENLSLDEITDRKSWKKRLTLKEGQSLHTGDIKQCRKIYLNVTYGTLNYEIKKRGRRTFEGSIKGPYKGGPLERGGGAHDWGNIKNIRFYAHTEVRFYVHIEWNQSMPFDFSITV